MGVSSTTNWYACSIAEYPPVDAVSMNMEILKQGTLTIESSSVIQWKLMPPRYVTCASLTLQFCGSNGAVLPMGFCTLR